MLCKAEDRTCTDRNRHDYAYTCNTAGGLLVRLFFVCGFWQGVPLLMTKLFQAGQAGCQ